MTPHPLNLLPHEPAPLLSGAMTVLWRVVKPQPLDWITFYGGEVPAKVSTDGNDTLVEIKNPFGSPGQELWGRETFAPVNTTQPLSRYTLPEYQAAVKFQYQADNSNLPEGCMWNWHPSTQMPRWASRLTLLVESVECRRVQSITNQEARLCGLPHASPHRHGKEGIIKDWGNEIIPDQYAANHNTGINDCWVCMFKMRWESIHGPGAWERNDWCWCATVKRKDKL